ncbi:MAG TPA: hypothetical protein VGB30_08075 [bacterium]|jgi:hypothetical protein
MSYGLGILIGTGILWLMDLILVRPIVNAMVSGRMRSEGVFPEDLEGMSGGDIAYWQRVHDQIFIVVDVIVSGIAGFIAGFGFGMTLIGMSFTRTGWPGMLAFIGLSFLGAYMSG